MSQPQWVEGNGDEMPLWEVIGFLDLPKWVIKLSTSVLGGAAWAATRLARGTLWSEKLPVRFLRQPIHHLHLRRGEGRKETSTTSHGTRAHKALTSLLRPTQNLNTLQAILSGRVIHSGNVYFSQLLFIVGLKNPHAYWKTWSYVCFCSVFLQSNVVCERHPPCTDS